MYLPVHLTIQAVLAVLTMLLHSGILPAKVHLMTGLPRQVLQAGIQVHQMIAVLAATRHLHRTTLRRPIHPLRMILVPVHTIQVQVLRVLTGKNLT